MNKTIIKFQILFLIFTCLFLSKNGFTSAQILTTDHFIIRFNNNSVNCAVASASRLELYHNIITSYLGIETMDRVNIFLTPEKNISFIPVKKHNELYISTDSNFTEPENKIYNELFLLYLREIMPDGKGISIIDKNIILALMRYPVTEQKFTELIINDLVNNSKITSIEFTGINKYDKEIQLSIYTALIDFITIDYTKKTLIQALKDADYYGGFYESLSKITGDSVQVISGNFSSYLQKHKSDMNIASNKLLHENGEYTDISYSISENGQLAVLQKNNGDFRLILKDEKTITKNILKHSENGTVFKNPVFISNNQIALTEIHESGSTIHIYNTGSKTFSGKMYIPYLFISDINYLKDRSFIFSAGCGLTSDIYTLDMNTGKFNIITESGNNFSPAILNDKVYFISNTDKSSIIELNVKSGEIKTLFSTDQKISHLNSAKGEKLIFSLKISGLENIYTFDLQSGNLHRVTNDLNSSIAPQIYERHIFYLLFFKSKYQLFVNEYNPADI